MTSSLQEPSPMLGGLSKMAFMRRFWQRRPLLVRQAVLQGLPPLSRRELFVLARRDEVESRLVVRDAAGWSVRQGPLKASALPPVSQPQWTLLVQGVDLHVAAARALLDRFRFVPEARLDDLMLSWASDGGGVGAHVDSYDVFLLQVAGRRRWRVGPVPDDRFIPGLPLKILRNFEPDSDWLLEPGDMLYLPPGWGHDGVAIGECMTASIGFRAPGQAELGAELLARLADAAEGVLEQQRETYTDKAAAATDEPGRIPARLQAFARRSVRRVLHQEAIVERVLGELLSEPKPQVWFEPTPGVGLQRGVTLARASRMMYDMQHVFINGESLLAGGRDAGLMRQLADRRRLGAAACARASKQARGVLAEWLARGWLVAGDAGE